ncbi:MAG: hypothetical protein ACRDQZ_25165 [Mycobacteriales bacterium]
MTERQLIAIQNPCSVPAQTADPKFRHTVLLDGRLLTSLVTVNRCLDFNDGRAVWHSAVAVVDSRKIHAFPLAKQSDSTIRLMISYAKALLGGVGQIPSALESFESDIHYRRSLTDEELAQIVTSELWEKMQPQKRGRGTILSENL